jgi:lysophospholipid acyltransferase (LPLAT)-like uncharacterized protein
MLPRQLASCEQLKSIRETFFPTSLTGSLASRSLMPTHTDCPPFKRFAMLKVVPCLVLWFIKALNRTWTIRETGREHLDAAVAAREPAIAAFLHGRTFLLLRHMTRMPNANWVSMCSKSLDGEAMAQVEEKLGLHVVRGSSGQGGLEALQEMIQRVRSQPGFGAGLAVDGSRGPRGHVQGGIVRMARWTGGRILPMTASATRGWIFRRSWDRTFLPFPFARVEIAYGEPIDVPRKLNAAQIEMLRRQVEDSLLRLQATVDELAGFSDEEPVQAPIPA